MRFLTALTAVCTWLACSAALAQRSATLDRYSPSESPADGFTLSGPRVPRHLRLEAQLHLEYANDPLVFETATGRPDSELVALVADQLRAHLGVSLGLFDLLMLHVAMPIDLAMGGQSVGDNPTATGVGAGDLSVAARAMLLARPGGAAGVQLRVGFPTSAPGDGAKPGVAGESSVSAQPELLGEVLVGPVHLLANLGLRFREDFRVASATFTDELTFGAGGFIVLPPAERLQAHLEFFGSTPIDDAGSASATPLELLLGLKLALGAGMQVGLLGGLGLTRGYGSPDYRMGGLIAWQQRARHTAQKATPREADAPAQPEPEPETLPAAVAVEAPGPPDTDRDAVPDDYDECPVDPGPPDFNGCPQHVRLDAGSGVIALLDPIDFESGTLRLLPHSLAVIDEVALTLKADDAQVAQLAVHVVQRRGLDAMQLSKRRAVALAEALRTRGVPPTQLAAMGCGSNRPLRTGLRLRRGTNERVELRLIHPLPRTGMPSSLGCEAVSPEPVQTEPAPPAAPPAASPPEVPAKQGAR